MQSLFAPLFLALQERIQKKVSAIQWIDQDLGQLEIQANDYRPAVAFPAVLIEFPTTTYSNEGELWQWAEITIQLRLVIYYGTFFESLR